MYVCVDKKNETMPFMWFISLGGSCTKRIVLPIAVFSKFCTLAVERDSTSPISNSICCHTVSVDCAHGAHFERSLNDSFAIEYIHVFITFAFSIVLFVLLALSSYLSPAERNNKFNRSIINSLRSILVCKWIFHSSYSFILCEIDGSIHCKCEDISWLNRSQFYICIIYRQLRLCQCAFPLTGAWLASNLEYFIFNLFKFNELCRLHLQKFNVLVIWSLLRRMKMNVCFRPKNCLSLSHLVYI